MATICMSSGQHRGGEPSLTYRIHFTVEDMARVRVDDAPRPLLELGVALRVLQFPTRPLHLSAWRHTVLTRLPPQARMVVDLLPPHGWAPDFLVPAWAGGPQELLEKVRSVPLHQITDEVRLFAERQPLPSWAHRLGDDPLLLQQLYDSLAVVHEHTIAPYWPRIRADIAADRAVRARHLLQGGAGQLLAGLNPRRMRWNPPVLEVDTASGMDAELHLGGRGLLLVPSMFSIRAPVLDPLAEPQPLLTYPVHPAPDAPPLFPAAPPSAHGPATLAALLGRTRAAVLHTIAEHPGCTTTELAASTRIAPASASEHATVLREAGLITTIRDRHTALHSPTPTGLALLNSSAVHRTA